MSFAPAIDPKPDNYKKFRGVFEAFRLAMVGFLLILYIVTTLFALGYPLSIGKIIRFAIGILLIFIGKNLGKVKHNYTFGIKTPWTLASEKVWDKTHKVSGPLWIVVGLVWALTIFLEERLSFGISMGALFLVTFFGFIYSYILFQKLKKD